MLIIQGKASVREDEDTKIVANEMLFYDDIPQESNQTLWVKVPKNRAVLPSHITDVLAAYKGDTQVMIYNEAQDRKFLAHRSYWVTLSDGLIAALTELLGQGSVKVVSSMECNRFAKACFAVFFCYDIPCIK